MRVLAIETSTPQASLALVDGSKIVASESFHSVRAHNAAVFEPLGRLLEGRRDAVDLIAVGTGPGSYSGIRVGIAVANALGLALEVPVLGIPSVLAPADIRDPDYFVTGDARRRSFYLLTVSARSLAGEIELLEPEAFAGRLGEAAATGRPVLTFDEPPLPVDGLPEVIRAVPVASELAARAIELDPAERERLVAEPIEPIYLRAPHITTPKGNR